MLNRTTRFSLALCLVATVACGNDTDDSKDDDAGGATADATAQADGSTADDGGAADASPADAWTGSWCGEAKALPKPDPARKKFALSLFHFNVEYVIGGLDYTDASGKRHIFQFSGAPAEGWDNDKVEDWIVNQTLLPILQMYDKHPTWGVDIELQAYMVEVLKARHTETLDLLRKLVRRGQVELISFHYAAQLFLGFPREDHKRSVEATRKIFKDHCLELSDVVFNQEGQAGEGWQRALVKDGYKVGVYAKNLWQYVHHNRTPWPWYSSEGGTLIVGPGGVDPKAGIELAWDFFDDGELRAVKGKLNPYFAPFAKHDPKRVKEFEDKLLGREKAGYHITTIGDYVAHLDAKKVEKKKAPPLIDGTWQAKSTESIHRWLGGRSQAFENDEEDNRVRTLNTRASMHVRALQRLLDHAEKAGGGAAPTKADKDGLAKLWRLLWHAEVSDCSGVNPWRGEVMFGIDTSNKILADAKKLRESLLGRLGYKHARVDLRSGKVEKLSSKTPSKAGSPVDAPVPVTVTGGGRTIATKWTEHGPDPSLGITAGKRYELRVDFGKTDSAKCPLDKDGTETDCDKKLLDVAFARFDDTIRYCPGLIEDEVRHYEIADWKFQKGEAWLPLPNGLIGLGLDWWVIKHVRQTHIAARFRPDVKMIDFEDAANQPPMGHSWRFTVFKGAEKDALNLANRINIGPVVRY